MPNLVLSFFFSLFQFYSCRTFKNLLFARNFFSLFFKLVSWWFYWWFYTGISTNVEKVYLFIYFYCEYLTSAKVEEVNINSKLHVQDINKMCLVSHFEIQNRRTCMKPKQIEHVTLVCSLTLKPTRICWSYVLVF